MDPKFEIVGQSYKVTLRKYINVTDQIINLIFQKMNFIHIFLTDVSEVYLLTLNLLFKVSHADL